MIYPTLPSSSCEQLANQKVEGRDPAVEPHVVMVGSGDQVNLVPVALVAETVDSAIHDLPDKTDRDQFEGQASGQLFLALAEIPIEVLDDRGFWRYLSISMFWDFIAWREQSAFEAGHHLRYVDGRSNTEAVLNRMYLRAKAVGGDDFADLPGALLRATDFWRSHVIRVRTGSAPALTRAFVRMQKDQRMTVDPLRQFARAINRTWTNVVLNLYTDNDAAELIEELRQAAGATQIPDSG